MEMCGLTVDGRAICWGGNELGQLGNPVIDFCHVPVVGLLPLACWPTPIEVGGGHRFQSLAVGAQHACGVTAEEGVILCWGDGSKGQLGAAEHVPLTWDPVRVAEPR